MYYLGYGYNKNVNSKINLHCNILPIDVTDDSDTKLKMNPLNKKK
jgi:hypothetical protein